MGEKTLTIVLIVLRSVHHALGHLYAVFVGARAPILGEVGETIVVGSIRLYELGRRKGHVLEDISVAFSAHWRCQRRRWIGRRKGPQAYGRVRRRWGRWRTRMRVR